MDNGIWATWYDLADAARATVLEWTHDTYCPYLRAQPGYVWVAHYRYTGGGPQMEQVKQTAVGHTQDDIGTGNQYIATRKLVGVAGWAKHSVLYEFTSLESRLRHFEEPHESLALDRTRWESQVIAGTVHAPGSPFVGERIWPKI